ncbi:hypothetical protein ACVJBD_007456 [Rhizobium mongolense]
MVNATRRPTAKLVLHPDEREYLERQVRRRRVARSMSECCRIILRCADGLPSKSLISTMSRVSRFTTGGVS